MPPGKLLIICYLIVILLLLRISFVSLYSVHSYVFRGNISDISSFLLIDHCVIFQGVCTCYNLNLIITCLIDFLKVYSWWLCTPE